MYLREKNCYTLITYNLFISTKTWTYVTLAVRRTQPISIGPNLLNYPYLLATLVTYMVNHKNPGVQGGLMVERRVMVAPLYATACTVKSIVHCTDLSI